MKHQSHAMQQRNVQFGDPCESGYSTTTSSEEGTLQRGFTNPKKQGGFEEESFLRNPKFLEMVSKEHNEARLKRLNKKRSKTQESLESPQSPFSSTSSITFGIPNHIPTSFEVTNDHDDLTNDMTSSFEDLGFVQPNYVDVDENIINFAAVKQFQNSLENIKTYETAKPRGVSAFSCKPYYDPLHISDVTNGQSDKARMVVSTSPSDSSVGSPKKPYPSQGILKNNSGNDITEDFSQNVQNLASIKAITPPSPSSPQSRKSAFVVVKPRVIHPSPPMQDPILRAPRQAQRHTGEQFPSTPCKNTQIQRPTTLNYRPVSEQSPNQGFKLPTPSPIDGSIVYIPAQIDENGIARPVSSNDHHHGNGCCHGNTSNGKKSKSRKSRNDLPTAEVLSNQAVKLRKYLEKAEAKEVKKALEKLLKAKDPSSIDAMAKLFPKSQVKSDVSHCVRCHKDFNPNEPGRCILPHPEKMVTKVSQDSIGADFACKCCNATFRLIQMDFYEESTNALLTGHCYSGSHTTDPDSVDYRAVGGAAKSCEDFGCIEFYV